MQYDKAYENDLGFIEAFYRVNESLLNNTFVEDRSQLSLLAGNLVYYGRYAVLLWFTWRTANIPRPENVTPARHYAGLATQVSGGGAAGAGIFAMTEHYLLLKSTDRTGWTQLHFAAAGNAFKVAAFLIEKGAKTDIKDKSGRTYKDIADLFGYNDFRSAAEVCEQSRTKATKMKNNFTIKLLEKDNELNACKQRELESKLEVVSLLECFADIEDSSAALKLKVHLLQYVMLDLHMA